MNLNKQMSTKQTIVFIVVITIALFIVQQVVYGQNTSSSMVDKLIEDTKTQEEYKAELVKRIKNSTCTYSKDSMSDLVNITKSLDDLEAYLRICVLEGKIK